MAIDECLACGLHALNYAICDRWDCPGVLTREVIEACRRFTRDEMQRELPLRVGPNDLFEISGNNSPDPPDDDDEVHEPQDYTGDYPLEGDDGDDGDE